MTKASAIGIIIGIGNVGKKLSTKSDDLNTYLSTDGGISWKEISKSSCYYVIQDHGGIIAFAKKNQMSEYISYSLNYGQDWVQLKISEEPILITGIYSYPSPNR